jgi:hypothetical protein
MYLNELQTASTIAKHYRRTPMTGQKNSGSQLQLMAVVAATAVLSAGLTTLFGQTHPQTLSYSQQVLSGESSTENSTLATKVDRPSSATPLNFNVASAPATPATSNLQVLPAWVTGGLHECGDYVFWDEASLNSATDRLFYEIHPERNGQKLSKQETQGKHEWVAYKGVLQGTCGFTTSDRPNLPEGKQLHPAAPPLPSPLQSGSGNVAVLFPRF